MCVCVCVCVYVYVCVCACVLLGDSLSTFQFVIFHTRVVFVSAEVYGGLEGVVCYSDRHTWDLMCMSVRLCVCVCVCVIM